MLMLRASSEGDPEIRTVSALLPLSHSQLDDDDDEAWTRDCC